MTDEQLEAQIKKLVHVERQTTSSILKLINLAEARDLPLKRGFASTFDWLTRGLGYSASAASRRTQSARLLRAVPDVERKLETGAVNLTTLANAQRSIKLSEKTTGRRIGVAQKSRIIEAISNQSSLQAEATQWAPVRRDVHDRTRSPLAESIGWQQRRAKFKTTLPRAQSDDGARVAR